MTCMYVNIRIRFKLGSNAHSPNCLNLVDRNRCHSGGNSGANLRSISLRCYLVEVASEW